MAREPDKDITRLPKWAQDRIELAEREVKNLKAQLDRVSTQHPGTNVVIDYQCIYPDVELAPDSQITYYLGPDRDRWKNTVGFRMVERSGRKRLELRSGDRTLVIMPGASNAVEIGLVDRGWIG